MDREQLKINLKKQMIEYLNLLDISPEDINDDDKLFEGDLGLDSIASLELIVLLEREYGIKIKNPTEGRKILLSVNVMCDYILEHSNKL